MTSNTNSYKIILLGSDYLAPKLGGSAKIVKSYVDHYQRNNCTIGFWCVHSMQYRPRIFRVTPILNQYFGPFV